MALLFVIFIALLILGTEVGFAMIIAAWLGIELKTDRVVDLVMLPTSMLSGIGLYALVQIPLFILAGEVMNRGGITRRLIDFASVWVGRGKGSLGQVSVGANAMMAGISGSAVADAVAIGKAMIPQMTEKGYKPAYSSAVIAAGALIGPIIPPSIPMVVYAQMANTSVAKMFMSGLIPGAMLALGFMAICAIIGRLRDLPAGERVGWGARLRVSAGASWALLMPVIILVGIRMGYMTDTEIAAIAVVYALLVSFFVYRTLRLADLPGLLVSAGRSSAVILFLLAAAAPFSWLVAESQVADRVVEMIHAISTNPVVVLIIVNVFLLLVGLVLEPLPAMIIFLPALIPIGMELGIDPIHFGATVVINLMIGLITPPVGLLLFVVASISKTPFVQIAREVLPFLAWSLVVLLLVIIFPQLTLWLTAGL
ncbi:TRAP transporter large permease [Methylobrevis albus]|uniref:TRAP transporter large permease protein n=1 Tax=Methylobrevis albus TaxID=2793297 RepID=A0A931I384_9HYPH|nr:TRAP transporter large permease [Methylobrevis albus]MBH0238488.1 TRAP transporter large permease [Methylobrevis albus]